jgi:hypothetical protein
MATISPPAVMRPLPEEGALRQRLAALRRRRRLVVAVRGAGFTLTVLLLCASLACYLDWLYHLSALYRAVLLVVLLVHTVLVAYGSLLRPLQERSDDLSLALRVEEQYPNLNDALASAVEFLNQATPPAGESAAARREAVRRALGRSASCDFKRIIDHRGLWWACGEAVTVLALAVTLVAVYPAAAATALARLAVPFGTFEWPRLTQVELGEVPRHIGFNEGFELRGKVTGVIPARVTVVFRYDSFPMEEETVNVTSVGGQATFKKKWDAGRFSSGFHVRVRANDAESREYDVEVRQPPELIDLNGEPSPQLVLDIPPYTGLATPQHQPPGSGKVEAIAGTRVTLHAAANGRLDRAWIEYLPGERDCAWEDLRREREQIQREREERREKKRPLREGGVRLSAFLSPLGGRDALSAATLAAVGDSAWGRVFADIDENDRSHFTVRFMPRVAGRYVLYLEDEYGLFNSYTFDLNLYQDPRPEVRLTRPSSKTDVLNVVPDAVLTLRLSAEDAAPALTVPVGALRSIYLRYRTREGEPWRRWILHEPEATPAPPTRFALEMPVAISQFRRADGSPLRKDDVLLLQACADDFDDVTVNKLPGASEEVRINIVDHSGLELDINRKLTEIQTLLREQRDKEQAALQEVANAQRRLDQGETLTGNDLDKFRLAERIQRELQDRFSDKPDQLREQMSRVEEALKQNGMQNSPIRDRMRHVARELRRLAENDLVRAEQQLARARQQAEQSAQAADRARSAERQAEELEKKSANLMNEAGQSEQAARKTDDGRERDKLLNDAKRARDEAADLKKQATALRRQAEASKREAEKLQKESKTAEALAAARKRQEEVTKTLNDLLARLEPSSVVAEIRGEARDLLDAQRELEARVKKMAEKKDTDGKKPEELTLEQREELKAMRDAQQELEDRTRRLMERMKEEAKGREKTEPELAQKLKDAADDKERDKILGDMQDAREAIEKNHLNDAPKHQTKAAAGLEDLARKLGRQTEAEQEQLVKRLRQAAEELEKIKKEEEGLRKKIKELEDKKQKGGLSPKEEDELKRLKKQQDELPKKVEELAKRLSKEGRADRARQALERAAKNRDDMLERLNEAERELDRARQREQEVLEREQLTRILEVIERLRDRQAALITDTDDLRNRVKDFGKWTLGHRKSLLGLKDAQNGLKDEVEKIIPEDLATTPVFARMLQRSAEAMGLASKRAADLCAEVAPEDSSPDKLPDAELTKQQKQALLRLEQVIDAVKSQLEAPPPPAPKQPNNPAGAQPPDGSPSPQNGLPPLAQLKLLKTLQLDVNKRSEEFQKAHPDLNKLSDAEKAEYNSIIRDQQDVRELLEEMRRPPEEKPAADKPAEPKPEEGKPK